MLETQVKIKKILELAVHAPSGDNMQPWRFELNYNNRLDIFNVPERDQSLYNWAQQGAYIAHGALIENIILCAPTYGLATEVLLFPAADKNHVATINFTDSLTSQLELSEFITQRCTNRTKYADKSLNASEKEYLTSRQDGEIKILIADEHEQTKILARAISQGDRMIFENKTVHDFLFQHIRWTQTEELDKKDGLFLNAMELSAPQKAVFKLIKRWQVMRWLNKINFARAAVKANQELYKHGCGFGAVIIPNIKRENLVQAGRHLQVFWLKATKLKLGLQPLTGIPLLRQVIYDQEAKKYLSEEQSNLILDNYNIIKQQFKIGQGSEIIVLFRFGFIKKAPGGYSSRKLPEIKII